MPIVAVNLWYHVGSKNERPGRTGFAHLFEHLMFEGSEHYNGGFFLPLQQAGALLNGSTNTDRTNYWEVVPTSALELALWMESDRMGYLLPALTRERFETQRDVVLNERRQNYENRPYGMALMALSVGALSAGSSVSLADDRRRRRHARDGVRRRAGVLPHVLPSGERVAGAGGRHRYRARVRARRTVFRRDSRAARNRSRCAADASLRARSGSCSRIASSCRASTWRGIRRRCSPTATPKRICSRICSPTARRRVSIARSSTTNASRSTCRRTSIRANSAASSCLRRRPLPASR